MHGAHVGRPAELRWHAIVWRAAIAAAARRLRAGRVILPMVRVQMVVVVMMGHVVGRRVHRVHVIVDGLAGDHAAAAAASWAPTPRHFCSGGSPPPPPLLSPPPRRALSTQRTRRTRHSDGGEGRVVAHIKHYDNFITPIGAVCLYPDEKRGGTLPRPKLEIDTMNPRFAGVNYNFPYHIPR